MTVHDCRITAVAAGLNHTVALTVAGDIFMCGHNKHGALGLGDTANRFLPTKVNIHIHMSDQAFVDPNVAGDMWQATKQKMRIGLVDLNLF